MASLTKAQLCSELEALRIENQRLSAEVASLKSAAPAARPGPRPARTWEPSSEAVRAHHAYVAAMNAAKDEARRSGKSVIVRR